MGGVALRAAALFPDRIAAAAAFHGGRLATATPDTPNLLADRIGALNAAGIASRVTTHAGARHG